MLIVHDILDISALIDFNFNFKFEYIGSGKKVSLFRSCRRSLKHVFKGLEGCSKTVCLLSCVLMSGTLHLTQSVRSFPC